MSAILAGFGTEALRQNLLFYLAISPSQFAQVVEQLRRIMTQAVTPEELKEAKSYLIGSFPRKMDSISKRAWVLGYSEVYGLGLDYPWRYPELIQHLTPEDIQKVAEKYLRPEKYLLVVVGNKSAMSPLPGILPSQKKE